MISIHEVQENWFKSGPCPVPDWTLDNAIRLWPWDKRHESRGSSIWGKIFSYLQAATVLMQPNSWGPLGRIPIAGRRTRWKGLVTNKGHAKNQPPSNHNLWYLSHSVHHISIQEHQIVAGSYFARIPAIKHISIIHHPFIQSLLPLVLLKTSQRYF